MRMGVLTLLLCTLASDVAFAEGPVAVYVNEVAVDDAKLAGEAGALTSALCAALSKDKRVDVLCAPDVRQLLSFAATSSMMGMAPPATESLERRAAATRFVFSSRLVVDNDGALLTTTVGPRADGADLSSMFANGSVATAQEKVRGKSLALLDRLPVIAQRLLASALAPAPDQESAATIPLPAPLTPSSSAPAVPAAAGPAAAPRKP
jgi:hypothetical protein